MIDVALPLILNPLLELNCKSNQMASIGDRLLANAHVARNGMHNIYMSTYANMITYNQIY